MKVTYIGRGSRGTRECWECRNVPYPDGNLDHNEGVGFRA